MLGDLNIAEPKALIGFAGPRVIEQTIRQKLPGRISAQRVPARERHDRSRHRSARDESRDRERAALHGRRRRNRRPSPSPGSSTATSEPPLMPTPTSHPS